MPRSAPPADSDILSFIENAGVSIPAGMAVEGYAAAGLAEFERLTNRTPFLASDVDSTRYFDPPGAPASGQNQFYRGGEKMLELGTGLVSVTSIALGVTADNPSGQTMDLSRQLALKPLNAPANGWPYSIVEFFFPVYGATGSIKITGKWGYCSELPEDAYQAILRLGAWMAMQDLAESRRSRPTSIKDDEVTIAYDAKTISEAGSSWRSFADRVIERYRMVAIGL